MAARAYTGLNSRAMVGRSESPTSQEWTATSKSIKRHPAYPIPRRETPYTWAKRAEYIERDLAKATYFYRMAIETGERVESAVKDLAGVLHQQGRTQEACMLLEKYRHLFAAEVSKYENLLNNLQKQVVPSGNCLNKHLKISGLRTEDDEASVIALFSNPSRIKEIHINQEQAETGTNRFAALHFGSHSAARKTLEGFEYPDHLKVEWMSITGEVTGEANYKKKPLDFSYFSKEKSSTCPSSSDSSPRYYSYFPEAPCPQLEDMVEDILAHSILSYFSNGNIDLAVPSKAILHDRPLHVNLVNIG
jgi:hypothetical protein